MDTCPRPTSKQLAHFTDGVNGVSNQILKIFSMYIFFKEVKKGWQSGLNCRTTA
jgi:hypothetical protein